MLPRPAAQGVGPNEFLPGRPRTTDDRSASMFIQTEETPNPLTLKFLPGRAVLGAGTADFPTSEAAEGKSPLAETLFGIEGVGGVFLGPDFITVTKRADADWPVMKPAILGAIMEHFTANRAVINQHTDNSNQASEEDDPVVSQ